VRIVFEVFYLSVALYRLLFITSQLLQETIMSPKPSTSSTCVYKRT